MEKTLTKERFWLKMRKEEFPISSKLRWWWERKKFDIWWSVDENRKFVEDIPDDGECFSLVRKGKVIDCNCEECF